jgi:hypothetical protein
MVGIMPATLHKKENGIDWAGSDIFLLSLIGLGTIALIWVFVEPLINLFI